MPPRPASSRPQGSPTAPTPPAAAPNEVEVTALIGSGREVVLLHNGERYRLRITANGKLILTK